MEGKRISNINTIVENVRKGKWSGVSNFSLGTFQFGRRREIIQPFLHWLDERALKNSLNSFFNDREKLKETVEKICLKRQLMVDADVASLDIMDAYKEEKIPLHFIYDLFNWYYFEVNKVEMAARKPYNSFSYKLLEKLNHPVMRVLTNHYPLKTMVMVRSLLLQLYFSYAVRKQRQNPNAEAIFEQFVIAKAHSVNNRFKEQKSEHSKGEQSRQADINPNPSGQQKKDNPGGQNEEYSSGESSQNSVDNSRNENEGKCEQDSQSKYSGFETETNNDEEESSENELPPPSLNEPEESVPGQSEGSGRDNEKPDNSHNTEYPNQTQNEVHPSADQQGNSGTTPESFNDIYGDEDDFGNDVKESGESGNEAPYSDLEDEFETAEPSGDFDDEYDLDDEDFDEYSLNGDTTEGNSEYDDLLEGLHGNGGAGTGSGLGDSEMSETEPFQNESGEGMGNNSSGFKSNERVNNVGVDNPGPLTRQAIDNLLEELVNKSLSESGVMEFGEEILQDAKETMNNIDQVMSIDESAKTWNGLAEKSGTDLHELLSKTDKTVLNEISNELKKIRLNMTRVKQSIKKLLDRSLSYFSAAEEQKFEHFFDAESIDGLQDFEFLHPKIRNLFIDDLLVREFKKAGKIDVYIDISTSMREPSGLFDDEGRIITKAAFSKAILVKLKEMDMLNDLFVFNHYVEPKSNSLIDILSIRIYGATDINTVLKSIEKTGRNSLIITDAEDRCDIYDERAFFLGVYGAQFSCFEEHTAKQYALKNQWCVFDGKRVYNVNANGFPIGINEMKSSI
jgi:hypothetical protein